MGTAKKEKNRKARSTSSSEPKTTHTKGENFYRTAKRVQQLNLFKNQAPTRNAAGKITQSAPYQSTTTPKARIEPNRKWFTNTRVISQDALSQFRTAMEERSKDPFSVLLKGNKLPMSLIRDGRTGTGREMGPEGLVKHQAKTRVEGEGFGETFGPKSRRKRVRLGVGSLEDMATQVQGDNSKYEEKLQDEGVANTNELYDGDVGNLLDNHREDVETATAREPVFSKGQSKRIWNELYKVIDSSDVVIHVLDARDPMGTRCRSVEKYIREEAPHKHLLFLLNKCDLVPTGVAAKWVRLLNTEYPTLAFHASLTNSFGKGTLISLLRQFSSLHSSRKQISVGFIGYPNTGKSSIINTLRKKKVCKTAPVPGETKVWQYITLMKRIYLIDCPGIVPPSMGDTPEELLLRGSVRVENVENPAQYVPAVLGRCKRHHLERTYGVKDWSTTASSSVGPLSDPEDNMVGTPATSKQKTQEAIRFLEALARKGGRLLKGGEADLDGVAKMVLNDFLRGKIPWFCAPPAADGEGAEGAVEERGRDAALGFTHGKRKRELEDNGVEVEDEEGNEGDGVEGAESEFESFSDENVDVDVDEESGSEGSAEDVGQETAKDGGVVILDEPSDQESEALGE